MINKLSSCPYCEKTFTDSDDVVYCPECGTPHHRSCWKEHGACANESLHAENFVWKSDSTDTEQHAEESINDEEPDTVICPKCAAECPKNSLVCPECGNRFGIMPESGGFSYNSDYFMKDIAQSPNEDIGEVTAKDAAMYVQNRAASYVKKFSRQKESGKKTGWNWAAFLFSPFWFFYRKLYKAGICFFAVAMAITLFIAVPMSDAHSVALKEIEKYVPITEETTPEELQSMVNSLTKEQTDAIMASMKGYSKWMLILVAAQMIPNIAAAIVADGLYKKKIVKDVKSMREFAQNERTFEMLVLRRGGVSVFGLLACYLLFGMAYNLLYLI